MISGNSVFWFLRLALVHSIFYLGIVNAQKSKAQSGDGSGGLCVPNPPQPPILSAPFSTCAQAVKSGLAAKHPDQDKKTPEILKKYNYPFKTYNVTTKDDYILTVYRITGSPNSKSNKKTKKAVYINHGIGGASDQWNFLPGSRNLPFKLADAGYEVWLGNGRGTTYSLGHKKLNAYTELPYWNFSFHEMGVYDVPAVTQKIITESKNKQIFYIGHSMGTTQYFVSLSEIPDMNKKIQAGFLLAPIAFLGHMNSPLRLATPLLLTDVQYQAVNVVFQGRIQSAQQLRTNLKLSPGDFCDATAAKCGVCDNLLFLLFGYDAPQVNNTEIPNLVAKFPNNMSVKQLAHYSQLSSNCKFRQFDYGPAGNKLAYKNRSKLGQPPDYNLKNIKAPTYFFYGMNDNLAQPNDVNITASKLSPGVLKKSYKVNLDTFNHIDFISAKDADKLVYNIILKEMKTFK